MRRKFLACVAHAYRFLRQPDAFKYITVRPDGVRRPALRHFQITVKRGYTVSHDTFGFPTPRGPERVYVSLTNAVSLGPNLGPGI